ncbi:ATP-binding protein [Streptomyces sp. Wh19]|uniref:ATP-binding protein n=1 Tax=Streptomyces sp. Wh19 TaxID=3076629 RepID=UPI002958BA28|nr:ATP-binding protein [Streptomyces sp. Wh19]MDV9198241.1 ATP-binding protein [Streptomyces sp. Wh19]
MNHVIASPPVDAEPTYHADFAMGEHSARHLRRILRLYLKGWEPLDVADAAELALTELIANVVRYVPGRRCQTFIFLLAAGGVRVEVADACPDVPRMVVGDELDEGGRGLVLVDAVTDKWGVEPRPDGRGKTVWFECLAVAGAADRAIALSDRSAAPRAPRP